LRSQYQARQPRTTTTATSGGGQLSHNPTPDYIHVMSTNFSHDEIELKKGTILGVAEETNEELMACVNETNILNSKMYNEATELGRPLISGLLE
jgi:hypothetical protein